MEPKTFLSLDKPSSEELIVVEMNGVKLGTWRRYLQNTRPVGEFLVAHSVKTILVEGLNWQAECDREYPTDGTVADIVAPRCPGCYKALEDRRKYAVSEAD